MANHWKDRVEIVEGDITRFEVDAIVNAANSSLLGGGGVDGAIHRAAGPALLEACRPLGGCPTGEVRVTPGFDLPATWVIHAVGPVWGGGERGEDDLLRSCYQRALEEAASRNLGSMAFPAISTGVYRFPLERATGIALSTTRVFLEKHAAPEKVLFVCFGAEAVSVYEDVLAALPGAPE